MLKLTFLSFLAGFVLVGAACSSKPATQTVPVASPSAQSMSNPDDSQASEEAPLSSSTDVDSLQSDLDNTDVSSLNSISTQLQTEVTQK
jgi:hypothetical protein